MEIILTKYFLVPCKEELTPRTLKIGREEFGLVDPIDISLYWKTGERIVDKEKIDRVLVYEEEQWGRYRVIFGPEETTRDRKTYDSFRFMYWTTTLKLPHKPRLTLDIAIRDPMKPYLERILSEAKKVIVKMEYKETLEQIMRILAEW